MDRLADFREEGLAAAATRFGTVFRAAALFFPEAGFPAVFFAAGFFFDAGFVAPDFLGVDFFAAGFFEVCFFAVGRFEVGFLAAVFRFCFPEVLVFDIYFISRALEAIRKGAAFVAGCAFSVNTDSVPNYSILSKPA